MGASNTPIYDLVELQGLLANTTYTTAPGGGGDIIGFVDNATYTDSHSGNTSTNITELNDTADADAGRLTIDGVVYNITLVTPTNTSNPVTVTYNNGASTRNLTGDDGTSQVAFIIAEPVGGGSTRWFMVVDDTVGNLPDITSIQTRNLDFNPSGDDVQINVDQNNFVTVCFVEGTLIATPEGPRPVEGLAVGDAVLTRDHGARPVLWLNVQQIALDGAQGARHAPIRIRRGALGPGLPARDLRVSPQHRILIASKIVERLTGGAEVLVPAKKLVGLPGIAAEAGASRVRYVHFFLGTHEVVLAEGAPAESLLPETGALAALPPTARRALAALTPGPVAPARPILDHGPVLAALLRRHRKNAKPLVSPEAARPATVLQPFRLVS